LRCFVGRHSRDSSKTAACAVPDRQRRLGDGGDGKRAGAGRLVQAIGAGSALTLVRAIARDAYRAEQLVKAIAYLTMFGTLVPMVSPFIGGVLTDVLGWRSVFGFAHYRRHLI
jgi:hypothetical protein